jgi:hypothetical protein
MVGKIIFTILAVLLALISLRWFSEKPVSQKVRIKGRNTGKKQPKQLVWDEASQSCRADDR